MQQLSEDLLYWYAKYGRQLPWRSTKNPYKIWISEIILQQTQVKQGTQYYHNFIQRFPTVQVLAAAHVDEVLLYWKGLGYYSRAINLHKTAQHIAEQLNGIFPSQFNELIQLKGVGNYTASAMASICFNERKPAIDGNLYRILSRLFADPTDIKLSSAFTYFANLALGIMPTNRFGDFNQALMDLGAHICTPKNPKCGDCPINKYCLALKLEKTADFPVKNSRLKVTNEVLDYYFMYTQNYFLAKQRDDTGIWRRLFDFPSTLPKVLETCNSHVQIIEHKLTHKKLQIRIHVYSEISEKILFKIKNEHNFLMIYFNEINQKTFPKPLTHFLHDFTKNKVRLAIQLK